MSEWGPEPKRRLISVALLPSMATLGNLICGVVAILLCLFSIRSVYFVPTMRTINPSLEALFPTYVTVGAYLIVLAMVFDVLDGRLARMTRQTSEFGAQLDSLADVVSFGVAPILLFLTLLMRLAAPLQGEPVVHKIEWRLGVLCGLVYVSCAAIRLARYNAENQKGEEAQREFSGLPTPGAAAVLISLMLLHESLRAGESPFGAWDLSEVVRWAVAPIAFSLGLLMVSRLAFTHLVNQYVSRERPPTHLVGLVVLAGVGWFSPHVMLVILAFAYVIAGLVNGLRHQRALAGAPHVDLERTAARGAEREWPNN